MRIPSGIKVTDLVIGSGAVAESGKTVCVDWRGWLNRGEEFGHGASSFRIGRRDVIAGIDRGVIGMRIGGVRRLRISPHFAYREKGAPGIPPNAVLEFEVKLTSVLMD